MYQLRGLAVHGMPQKPTFFACGKHVPPHFILHGFSFLLVTVSAPPLVFAAPRRANSRSFRLCITRPTWRRVQSAA
jgi:hypothetical protein